MIKILISSLIVLGMTGCVTNYYPLPESSYVTPGGSETVVYGNGDEVLIEDSFYDESYSGSPARVISTTYVDTTYYPWHSMDYFYLGGGGYRPYYGSHFYRPYYGSSFSFGFGFGYPYFSPYDYPRYYSSWFAPYYYYGGGYAWGGGYSHYDPYWGRGYGRHGYRSDRYAGSYGNGRGNGGSNDMQRGYDNSGGNNRGRDSSGDGHRGRGDDDDQYQAPGDGKGRRSVQANSQPGSKNRNTWTTPSTAGSDGGRADARTGAGKVRHSRPEPINRETNSSSTKELKKSAVRSSDSTVWRKVEPSNSNSDWSQTGVKKSSGTPSSTVAVNQKGVVTQSQPSARKQAVGAKQTSWQPRTSQKSNGEFSKYNRPAGAVQKNPAKQSGQRRSSAPRPTVVAPASSDNDRPADSAAQKHPSTQQNTATVKANPTPVSRRSSNTSRAQAQVPRNTGNHTGRSEQKSDSSSRKRENK